MKIIMDYNGNPVLSAFAPLKIGNTTWALIAEIDESEAFASVNHLKWLMGIIAIIGMLAIITVALLITRSITKPINRIITGLNDGSDLVALVGGKGGQASTVHARPARKKAPILKRPTLGKTKALAAPKRKQAARKDAKPEEVFPLDDKDFDDF